MALTQKTVQKQSGSLTLTPQLRQAIKLLELSNIELESYLAQEILDNPLLEMAPKDATLDSENPPEKNQDEDAEDGPERDDRTTFDEEAYDNLWSHQSETDRWQGSSSSSAKGGAFSPEDFFSQEESLRAAPVTLRDHLLSQLQADFSDPIDLMIGTHLIESLEESGYLTAPLEDISEKLGCPRERIEQTLTQLKECDPPGIFAADLSECLTLQLKDSQELDHPFVCLLSNLNLYADGKIDALLSRTELTRDELGHYLKRLQRLCPKPGLLFDPPVEEAFQPDVFVQWHEGQQEWRLHLNEATLPKLLINTGYYGRVTQEGTKEVKAYLKESLKSANWLTKALDQRAQTILKVSSEIVKQQDAFLKKGLNYLKPMTLKDIAAAVDLHESTVSRVTQHKYMVTPRGTFDMKIFFSSSVASMSEEETHSASSVQHLIQNLVSCESPSQPFSDDQLVQALAEKGIDVARRTISKYRKIMKIPSSYERKKHYLRQL